MAYRIKPLILASVLLAVMGIAFTAGCNNQVDEISAELGREVELGVGQTVVVRDEPIKLKFVEVAGDSRCPAGATCIWEGEVTCILEITYLDDTYTTSITQPGLTQQKSLVIFHQYEVTFTVLPYPELDKEIKDDEYRLQLVIDTNPLLSGWIMVQDFS